MAVPFLTDKLGALATLAVEVAWGADLGADSQTWVWTDITTDVRMGGDAGISARLGRSDEAGTTQPASCNLALDNESGDYSLGGDSPNWPNVRASTPLRVRVDPDGAGADTLFFGYVDTWSPSWSPTAAVATVEVSASGILRRLAQNTAPVMSSMRRRLTTETNVVAYWPLEDGRDAISGASALRAGTPMLVITGAVSWASSDRFACSLPVPVIDGASLAGVVAPYVHTGQWQVRTIFDIPDAGLPTLAVLLRVFTEGTFWSWEIVYSTGGSLRLIGRNRAGTAVFTDGPYAFNIDGKALRIALTCSQVGTGIEYSFQTLVLGATSGSFITATRASSTLGPVTRVIVMETATGAGGLAVGHVVVQDQITSLFDDSDELRAFDGEAVTPAGRRLDRLCAENAIAYEVFGDGTTTGQTTDQMGPQRPAQLLALLREAETVDQGIMFDGRAPGLSYRTRRFRENRAVSLILDVAAGELAQPPAPVDDDQVRVNRAVVNRPDGATAVAEDATGPLGTAAVGIYDSALSVAVQVDSPLAQYAGWLVHKGTIGGYRHPTLSLDLAAAPQLVAGWLGVTPGSRIDVAGLAQVATQHPDETVALEVQGWAQDLNPFRWTAQVNCAPHRPWAVGVLAQTTGEQGPAVWRLDSDPSTLTTGVAPGASTLSVETNRTNQIPNPSFEHNGIGWSASGGTAPARGSDVGAVAGEHAGFTDATGSGTVSMSVTDLIPAQPGQQVTVSVWVRRPTSGLVYCDLDWHNRTGGFVASSTTQLTVPANIWTRISSTANGPAGAGNARLWVRFASVTAGQRLWLDAAMHERSTLRPYVDGDHPGVRWSGVPHASVSRRGPAWTTTLDDLPLLVEIAGIPLEVTAITGAGPTQIFTVDASTVTKALPADAPVRLWRPPVLAL